MFTITSEKEFYSRFPFRVNGEIVEIIEIKITNKAIGTITATETTIIIIVTIETMEIIVCAITATMTRRRFAFGVTDFLYQKNVNKLVQRVVKFATICCCFRSRRHGIVVRFSVVLDRKETEKNKLVFFVIYPHWTINKLFASNSKIDLFIPRFLRESDR